MRKVILIVLIASLLPAISFTQNVITGLGPFKINKSTSFEILDSLKNEGYGIGANDSVSAEFPEDHYLVKKYALLYNPTSLKKFKQIAFSDAIISEIKIEQLYLSFYNDTLIAIKFHYLNTKSDLIHLFINKYTNYKTESQSRTIDCRSGLGITYQEKESEYYYNYPILGGIRTSAFTKYLFSSKCKEYTVSELFIRNNTKYNMVEPSLRKIKEQIRGKEFKKNQEKYNDL